MLLNLILSIAAEIYYFALHVTGTGSFPASLSKAQEEELLLKMAGGDSAARDKLIEHNLRLVAHVVKKYYTAGVETDDLISIGTIGLIKAINSFSPERNIKLATYAARCVENEVLMYLRSLKRTRQDVHISDPIDTDSEGNTLTLIDIIADDTDISEETDKKIKLEKLRVLLNGTLDQREKQIIDMRYGLGGAQELTQREIADKLGISRSYVSRIEKSALQKLRRLF